MSNNALWEILNFHFSGVFASTDEVFILVQRLGTRLSFYDVIRQLVRGLVYTIFISNNCTAFHLW